MKNWLGVMIIFGAAACQAVESPGSTQSPTESTTEQAASQGSDFCPTEPHYCGATLPALLWWTGLPTSTVDTVGLVDTKSVPGYWRIHGVDPVKGAVLWSRLAVPQQQAASVMTGLTSLPSGFIDYTRPPPCGQCPVGDFGIAENMLETGRLKLGITAVAKELQAACQ